jgi:thioredoxin 1
MTKVSAVTDATFPGEVEQQAGIVVVDFTAEWCAPCKIVAPIVEQLATEYAGRLKVVTMDADTNQRTAVRFRVRGLPMLMFFKDGVPVDSVVGAVPKAQIAAKFAQHAP